MGRLRMLSNAENYCAKIVGAFPLFPAAVPSHPYGITLLNCDGHSMTLGWKVPKFSGGSPILGYYVDKREGHHKNWHEVNSSPLKERILTVGVCGFVYFIGVIFLRSIFFLRRQRREAGRWAGGQVLQ